MQDPVPLIGKFGSIYARPGHRVLINAKGDMLVRPTPLDIKLGKAGAPSIIKRMGILATSAVPYWHIARHCSMQGVFSSRELASAWRC